MEDDARERLFWRTIRRALLTVVKAIEERYGIVDEPRETARPKPQFSQPRS